MARRATFVERQRAEHGRILLVDGGGFLHRAGADWQPSSIANWRDMERLGYDAVTLGELELEQWALTDSLLRLGTTLPLITTNIERRAANGWEPVGSRCRVVEVDGVRVGFLSALAEDRVAQSVNERAGGDVRVLPMVATTREVARLLKGVAPARGRTAGMLEKAEARRLAKEPVDLLVLIGYLDDPDLQTLADSIPEIDAMLGGIHQPRDAGPVRMGQAIVQRPGDRGGAFAVTELIISPADAIVSLSGRAALLDDSWPEDPQVAATVAAANEASKRNAAATHERKQRERMERFRQMQAQREQGRVGKTTRDDPVPATSLPDSLRSTPGDSLRPSNGPGGLGGTR